MAVLTEHHAEVEVIVDGQPAQEYDNDDDTQLDTESLVTKYVEVSTGKEFGFRIALHSTFAWDDADTVVVRPFIDGKKHSGMCLSHHRFITGIGVSGFIRGEWSGSGNNARLFKFVFSDLETREMQPEDDVQNLKENYGNLGTFVVEFWKERAIEYHESTSTFVAKELQAIPEKALKGKPIDLATSYKVTSGTRPQNLSTQKLQQTPFATFRFKPRTRKALQALLILDRSPDPVPLEDRPLEELNRDELKELVRRQRAAQEVKKEQISAKRERANTNSTPMPPLKTSKGVNGKTVYTIDTEDDEDEDEEEGGVHTSGDQSRRSSTAESDIEVVTI